MYTFGRILPVIAAIAVAITVFFTLAARQKRKESEQIMDNYSERGKNV